MSAPAPGPFNSLPTQDSALPEGLAGMRNNLLARQLVTNETVEKLVGYMLRASESTLPKPPLSRAIESVLPGLPPCYPPSSDLDIALTSSLTCSISVFIELIRKNNSDYSEPHLFHTVRNALMAHSSAKAANASLESKPMDEEEPSEEEAKKKEQEDDARDQKDMEDTMGRLSVELGIVHLGNLLDVFNKNIGEFQRFVGNPRSNVSIV